MRNNSRMVYLALIALAVFTLLANFPLAGTFLKPQIVFAQNSLQLITQDTNGDGVADSAKICMPGCPQLGGGLGSSGNPGYCAYSDLGYLSCPPGDSCEINLFLIPPGYSGDVWVWMWCSSPWTYDCQTLKLGPTPPTVAGVQTYGSTYSELSARWWQWLLSIPKATNPNFDTTGEYCAQGQYDDVWFLAGAFGGTFERTCVVPAGKPIFFPLINSVTFKPFGHETLLDLRKQAAELIDSVTNLECTLDGKPCFEDRTKFRVKSPSFTVIAPPKGVLPPGQLTVPGNTDPIVSDGYWLLLDPPTPGQHTIKFKATGSNGFSLDGTYHLTIQE